MSTQPFKSQQEAWAYISQAHCPKIVNNDGTTAWFRHGHLVEEKEGLFIYHCYYFFNKPEDWRPYVEPPKSLTFDEAVKCRKVKVDPPGDYELWGVRVLERGDGWYMSELAFLDLAERRAWAIREVTE